MHSENLKLLFPGIMVAQI